uniref:Integrase core domain containing protein n=1 Tax=Solanum tuberosum TaxID=4113 RepID=M1DXY6_SOLTU
MATLIYGGDPLPVNPSTIGSYPHASANSASSSNVDSTGDAQDPRVKPVFSSTKANMWCVEGQYHIYNDGKVLNENRKMATTITEERRVFTGSLHTVPAIEDMFKRQKCEWTPRNPGNLSEEMTREFYASYTTTV